MCQCGMCLHQKAAQVYVRTSEGTRKLRPCSVALGPFRLASILKWPFCMGQRNGPSATEQGLRKRCHTPCFFLLVSLLFVLSRLLFSLSFTSSSSLSFLQLNTLNYDHCIIQTLSLHFNRSTPLRKTLTVNHYLHIEYFQQGSVHIPRVILHDPYN